MKEQTATARKYLSGIEALRAYAALSIVAFHVIHILGLSPAGVLGFVKWNAGFGVPLFFCISAFSLAYGYTGRLETMDQVKWFYLRRLCRIAPLYYAVLLFMIGVYIFNRYHLSPTTLLLNTTFLFNLSPQDIDGMVPASWSIGVEMLFYALLPLILLLTRRWVAAIAVTLLAVAVGARNEIGLGTFDPKEGPEIWHSLSFNLPYFMLGLLAYKGFVIARLRWPRHALQFSIGSIAAGLAVIAALNITGDTTFPVLMAAHIRILYDIVWGVGFALICLGMALTRLPILAAAPMLFLGRISFSLYLLHPHIVNYGKQWGLFDWLATVADKNSAAYFGLSYAIVLAILVPLAWLSYRFIEVPGMALGRRLHDKYGAAQPA